MRTRLTIILLTLLLTATFGTAYAKDFKFNTAIDGGYLWMFAYDRNASHIDIEPALTYGGTLFQIADFSWSRNMVGELNYLYAATRGEGFSWHGNDSTIFDLTMHHSAFNVGYFFEGRYLHPYISGGVGAMALLMEPLNEEKTDEIDVTINLGGGMDYTLKYFTKIAMERLDLGFRVQYFYVFQQEIVDTAFNAVALTVRLNLRW